MRRIAIGGSVFAVALAIVVLLMLVHSRSTKPRANLDRAHRDRPQALDAAARPSSSPHIVTPSNPTTAKVDAVEATQRERNKTLRDSVMEAASGATTVLDEITAYSGALKEGGTSVEPWTADARLAFDRARDMLAARDVAMELPSVECYAAGCAAMIFYPDDAMFDLAWKTLRNGVDGWHGPQIITNRLDLDGRIGHLMVLVRPYD